MTSLLRSLLSVMLLCFVLAACAPKLMAPSGASVSASLGVDHAVMDDGVSLPLRVWAAEKPHAIVVGIHGFNDYSNAFDMPGAWFAERGVTTYAFDQRGFGHAPGKGEWAGGERMAQDLANIVRLVRARHPGLPLYLMGESMGGGVAMRLYTQANPPPVDGVILAAPAVWGWRSMNTFYESVLWVAGHTVPGLTLTGRGLGRKPSDNIPMLRALGRDPIVIKKTRVGTIYGLVTLMDEAAAAARHIKPPVLLLYGAHDEIVPPKPVATVFAEMKEAGLRVTAGCYKNGWHMLLRDLERETVWRDMQAWMVDPQGGLPSGAEDISPCKALAKVD